MNKHGYHSSPTRAVLAARGIHFQLPNAINRYFGGKWPIISSPALSTKRRGRVGGCNVLPQRSHSDRAHGTLFTKMVWRTAQYAASTRLGRNSGFYSKFKALVKADTLSDKMSATLTRRQSTRKHPRTPHIAHSYESKFATRKTRGKMPKMASVTTRPRPGKREMRNVCGSDPTTGRRHQLMRDTGSGTPSRLVGEHVRGPGFYILRSCTEVRGSIT